MFDIRGTARISRYGRSTIGAERPLEYPSCPHIAIILTHVWFVPYWFPYCHRSYSGSTTLSYFYFDFMSIRLRHRPHSPSYWLFMEAACFIFVAVAHSSWCAITTHEYTEYTFCEQDECYMRRHFQLVLTRCSFHCMFNISIPLSERAWCCRTADVTRYIVRESCRRTDFYRYSFVRNDYISVFISEKKSYHLCQALTIAPRVKQTWTYQTRTCHCGNQDSIHRIQSRTTESTNIPSDSTANTIEIRVLTYQVPGTCVLYTMCTKLEGVLWITRHGSFQAPNFPYCDGHVWYVCVFGFAPLFHIQRIRNENIFSRAWQVYTAQSQRGARRCRATPKPSSDMR